MAIIKVGTFTSTGAAYNLNLGFVPSYFQLWDHTVIAADSATPAIGYSQWFNSMANASAYVNTYTSGAPVTTYITTNGYTPYFPAPGLEFVPTNMTTFGSTNLTITGISKAANASITATHPFIAADIGVTTVGFHNVVGMGQINTLTGVIQSVTSTTSFTVNINSTNFSTYVSGGTANVITGEVLVTGPYIQQGFQITNTPLYNTGFIGLTIGTSVAGATSDVMRYIAMLDASFTSD